MQHFGKRPLSRKKPQLSTRSVLETAGTLNWGLLCERGYCHFCVYARLACFQPRWGALLIFSLISMNCNAINGKCNRTATALFLTAGTMHRRSKSAKIERKSGATRAQSGRYVLISTMTGICAAAIEACSLPLPASVQRTARQLTMRARVL